MKKVLITGRESFVGNSVREYLRHEPFCFEVDDVGTLRGEWRECDLSRYDSVFHVAGIAHVSTGPLSEEARLQYFRVNTDLACEVALACKKAGVRQFIFMSSSIVYGDAAPIGRVKRISADTECAPANVYGESKYQAETRLRAIGDKDFKVVILRCPMIYGRGCKGNFPSLERIADIWRIFPKVKNERSLLYVGNLSEFVGLMIKNGEEGVFWPCNAETIDTSGLVKLIAQAKGKKITLVPGLQWLVVLASRLSKKVYKAFGSLVYEEELSAYKADYRRYSLAESVRETVGYGAGASDK